MNMDLRLASMLMDSVLCDSCAILFLWPNAVLVGLIFNPMGLGLSCFSFS